MLLPVGNSNEIDEHMIHLICAAPVIHQHTGAYVSSCTSQQSVTSNMCCHCACTLYVQVLSMGKLAAGVELGQPLLTALFFLLFKMSLTR